MTNTIQAQDVFTRVVTNGSLGDVMHNDDIDALTATSITSSVWLINSNWGTNQFRNNRGAILYRPGAKTKGDYIRYAGDFHKDTFTLDIDIPWADDQKGQECIYLLKNGVHPSWIIEAMNRGLDLCFFENSEPLSLAKDAGFQNLGISSWINQTGSDTGFRKYSVLGSSDVYSGLRSGIATNSVAEGNIAQRFSVNPGDPFSNYWLCKPKSGTARLILWDVTNDKEINPGNRGGDYAGKDWVIFCRWQDIMPANCYELEVRLTGVEDDAEIVHNGLWTYRLTDRRIYLDSKWDTAFKMPVLAVSSWGWPVGRRDEGTEVTGQIRSAFSVDLSPLPRDEHQVYDFLFERPGAHPGAVQLHDPTMMSAAWPYYAARPAWWAGSWWFYYLSPIYIQGRRAYSDIDCFDLGLGGSTSSPIELLDAATRFYLFQDERVTSRISRADERLSKARGDLEYHSRKYQQEGPAKDKPMIVRRALSGW